MLIAIIYNVHPAFKLAYSPTVVILAFFIMGLSLIVTLIIFFRFEEEMILLQRRATQMRAEEVSRWKAFAAAFFLGVSNLRRRRFRTLLTCSTLIILTFTIMSFTSVKSMRHHARLLYKSEAPYRGFLVKNVNWQNLPPEALAFLSSAFSEKGVVAPRVWWEAEDKTRSTPIPVRFNGQVYDLLDPANVGGKYGDDQSSIAGFEQTIESSFDLAFTEGKALLFRVGGI